MKDDKYYFYDDYDVYVDYFVYVVYEVSGKFHGTYVGIVDVENQGIANFSLKREDFLEKVKTTLKRIYKRNDR